MPVVATVLKSGGDFCPDHVWRIFHQVREFAPECSFVCLSDMPEEVPGGVPLLHNWPGWWSKIELFQKDKFHGPVLYMDLDTTIVAPFHDMFKSRFTMLRDFYRPNLFGSGLMAWEGDGPVELYENFNISDIGKYRSPNQWGDQGYIRVNINQQPDVFGSGVCSYKKHIRDNKDSNGVPDGVSIVCFHGKPRPWEVDDDFLR